MKYAPLPALLILTLITAFAEDLYIAQTNLGSANGTSAANARAYTWFNTSTNWTSVSGVPDRIGPGDTVHIVGVITNPLSIQGSGSPGNPITLKFDQGGKLRHPTSFGTGMINALGGLHDFVIEGGNATSVKQSTTQVDIEIFANGTSLPNQQDGNRGVFIDGAGSNITVKNLYIWGLYVRDFEHPTDLHASANSLTLRGQDNLVVENCAFQHAEAGPGITGIGAENTGIVIKDCLVLDTSTAIKLGCSGTAINKDAKIIGNRLDGFDRWGGIAPPNHHHSDGIQTITVGAGQRQDGLIVAYNHIGPNVGNDGHMNAHIFLEDFVNGAKVYNNFLETAPGDRTANQPITAGTHPSFIGTSFGLPTLIVNNTIKAGGKSGGIATSFANVFGNVVYNTTTYVTAYRQPGTELKIDKNVYWGAPFGATDDEFGVTGTGQGIYRTSQWQGLGYDVNSIFVDPKLNANGTLQAGSPAIGLAPTQTFFNDDFYGKPRSAPWDAGAIEFGKTDPLPKPTPTPIPGPTPTPTSTPTPTPLPTPTLVATPSPTPPIEGMWNVSGTVIKTQSGFRIDLVIED